MPIIQREKETSYGIVIEADIKSAGVPFWEGATLPAVCLPDAERYRARYTIRLGSGDESRNLSFKVSGSKRGYWPQEGSQVAITSTRVRILGLLPLPLVKKNRLAI